MLRSCACFQRQRRGSSFEDSSSCRSSEIERGSEVSSSNGSILKLITSRGWCRQWRKAGSTISMSKIERSKYYGKPQQSFSSFLLLLLGCRLFIVFHCVPKLFFVSFHGFFLRIDEKSKNGRQQTNGRPILLSIILSISIIRNW